VVGALRGLVPAPEVRHHGRQRISKVEQLMFSSAQVSLWLRALI
jgi:hypothetical protein